MTRQQIAKYEARCRFRKCKGVAFAENLLEHLTLNQCSYLE
jgi:hypothetical protein